MFHIRFLKVPYTKPQPLVKGSRKKSKSIDTKLTNFNGKVNTRLVSCAQSTDVCAVSSVVTLTTELGDDFFYRNAELRARLLCSPSGKNLTVVETVVHWECGMRALPIELQVPVKQLSKLGKIHGPRLRFSVKVEVQTGDEHEQTSEMYVDDDGVPIPIRFVPIESLEFKFAGVDDRGLIPRTIQYDNDSNIYVKREVLVGNEQLKLVEEIGDSMAKHLWDSGILLSNFITESTVNYNLFIEKLSYGLRPTHIMELGCGCGTVGLLLSKVFPSSRVLLTDLESAREVCLRNISLNSGTNDAQRRANGKVEFCCFDWDCSNNNEPENERVIGQEWDLVVSCDCTYNADSFDMLTDVLLKVVSAKTKLLLVHKERHDSENKVFDMLKQKNGLQLFWRKHLEPIGAKARVDILVPIS